MTKVGERGHTSKNTSRQLNLAAHKTCKRPITPGLIRYCLFFEVSPGLTVHETNPKHNPKKIGESYQHYLNVFILSSCHLKLHIIAKVVFPLRSGILFPLFYRFTGTFRSCYHHNDCLPETIESFISCQSSI